MGERLTLSVPGDLDGERIDKVLAVLLDVSRADARSLFEREVLLDGRPVRPGDRVSTGGVIRAPALEEQRDLEAEEVPFGVVVENEAFIVVDKPAGMVVHPGSGRTGGTLAAGLLHRYPELEGVGAPGRWGLVHRLDKDTSGVLLVATTADAFEALASDMAARRIKRTYLALVDGLFGLPTGTIEAPIGRDPERPTRRAISPDGKHAVTHYEMVEEFPTRMASLLEVKLETGRTHQIRVHLAAIGHPVIGDRVYGRGPTSARSPRIFLHARRLEFSHPTSGGLVSAEAPLPDDLGRVLEELRAVEAQ